jgi:hypothetical protein
MAISFIRITSLCCSSSRDLSEALQEEDEGGKVGGFPYLAETLRRAGITRNLWFLPACQSLYLTQDGPVVTQGTPLVSGTADVPPFNLIARRPSRRCSPTRPATCSLLARWRCTLRCRFRRADGRKLRLQRRGLGRSLSGHRYRVSNIRW